MMTHINHRLLLHTAILLSAMNMAQSAWAQTFSRSYDLNQTSNIGMTIIPVEDGILISVLSICNLTTTPENCVGLLKTDFNGNVVWTRVIEGFKTPTMNSMIVDSNYIYLAIRHNIEQPKNIKVLKLDMAGNTLTEWDLGETQDHEYPFGIIRYREGFVIYSLLFPSDTPHETAWILYTDDAFTPTHEVFFAEEDPDYGLVVSKDLLATQDGNLIATQRKINGKGGVTKLDTAGQIIWHTQLPFSFGSDNITEIHATELQDGGYAVSWFRDRPDMDTLYPYPPAVFRLNAAGQVLWEKVFDTYYHERQIKYINNLFTASNGDIVGTGYRHSYQETLDRSWLCGLIFRLDPDSGEVLWEHTLCDFSRSQQYRMAFIAGAELPGGDLVFTGLYEDTFPNGLPFINDPNAWLVRVGADGCVVEDCGAWTIINPDGSITETIETEALSASNRFMVYPNPGNGQLWVAAKEEAVSGRSGIMLLYDTQGRPVKIAQLTVGPPQHFDWSDLLSGMYYYQIRVEGLLPQNGKIVIGR